MTTDVENTLLSPAPPRSWRPPGAAATVGVARCDITPPVGIRARNWGAGRSEVSTGVHRPITATAMSVRIAGRDVLLVTADLGWFSSPEHDRSVRGRIVEELDADVDDVLLHLVHTHAGPTTAPDEVELPGGELIGSYVDQLVAGIADACRRAAADAQQCSITWGYGHCDLAVVRDLPCGGRDVVAFNPDVPADDTVAVGRVSRPDGSLAAVLVNYACHPTTLAWENSLLSPDYVAEVRQVVEEATGGLCLFLQGACGDVSPREQYVGDTEVADRNGRMLGLAVTATLAAMPPAGTQMVLEGVVESGAALGVWRYRPGDFPSVTGRRRTDVEMPIKAEVSAQEIQQRWSDIDQVAAEERVRRAARLRASYAGSRTGQHPVWVWRIGDAAVVAQPAEAFSLLQVELRRRHPDKVIFVLSLTNGPGYMYLPNAASYEHDRYQVWQTLYGQGSLEALIDEADAALAELWENDGARDDR